MDEVVLAAQIGIILSESLVPNQDVGERREGGERKGGEGEREREREVQDVIQRVGKGDIPPQVTSPPPSPRSVTVVIS